MPIRTDDKYPARPPRTAVGRALLVSEHDIEEGSISTDKIADGAVQWDKLDPSVRAGAIGSAQKVAPIEAVDSNSSAWVQLVATNGILITRGGNILVNVSGMARVKSGGTAGSFLLRVEADDGIGGVETTADFPMTIPSTTGAYSFSLSCFFPVDVDVIKTFRLKWKTSSGGNFSVTSADFVTLVVTQL